MIINKKESIKIDLFIDKSFQRKINHEELHKELHEGLKNIEQNVEEKLTDSNDQSLFDILATEIKNDNNITEHIAGIGIDLGTTNSLLAICYKEKPSVAETEILAIDQDFDVTHQHISSVLDSNHIKFDLESENSMLNMQLYKEIKTTVHQDQVADIKQQDCNIKLLPSIVLFEKTAYGQDIVVYVGQSAESLDSNFSKAFRSIKRLMGKGLRDLTELDKIQYNIDYEHSNDSIIRLNAKNGRSYTSIEISAEILKNLKARLKKTKGIELKDAVITVPANFNEAARIATCQAAKLAEINVLRLLNEPTAAALAYGLDQNSNDYFLIYDLGGGTFDVSILNAYDGVFQVIATNGDNNLGGDDFDAAIVNLLDLKSLNLNYNNSDNTYDNNILFHQQRCSTLKLKEKKEDLEYSPNRFDNKLPIEPTYQKKLVFAKKIKEHLTLLDEWYGNWYGTNIVLKRAEFETITLNIVNKTLKILEDAMSEAKLFKNDISEIVLVGGATRMPMIKSALYKKFNKHPLDKINPDEIVVIGAAVQAAALINGTANHLLLDVTPLSLGIELADGMMDVIIPRNTATPTEIKRIYTTACNDQIGFKIHILQGEAKIANQCRSLASFDLKDIAPSKAGSVRLEVIFRIDVDGLLTVHCKELSSGKFHYIELKPSYGLTEDEIKRLLLVDIQEKM